MHSPASEDYLKAIYEIQHERGEPWVSTTALAETLSVTPASVTEMIHKLADDERKLVTYERYHGVRLAPAGERVALQVIRHHRLLERFLSDVLGYEWDQVHAEAHRLEHVISEQMEERIATVLGNPRTDPHGAPIPDRDGMLPEANDLRLTDLPVGQPAIVRRVSDDNPALLRYLAALGLTPETPVEAIYRAPFAGPLHVRLLQAGAAHALGREVTDHVFVELGER